MSTVRIIQKKYVPIQEKELKDKVLAVTEDLLITEWKANPRERREFTSSINFMYLKEGYKIGARLDVKGNVLWWYIDVIDLIKFDETSNTYIVTDMILDVFIRNGKTKILDENELAFALKSTLITHREAKYAREKLQQILLMMRNAQFPPKEVKKFLNENGYNWKGSAI